MLPLTDAKYSCPFCSRRSWRVKWFTIPTFVYGYISIPPIVEPESFFIYLNELKNNSNSKHKMKLSRSPT
jgi:hypothetical protein